MEVAYYYYLRHFEYIQEGTFEKVIEILYNFVWGDLNSNPEVYMDECFKYSPKFMSYSIPIYGFFRFANLIGIRDIQLRNIKSDSEHLIFNLPKNSKEMEFYKKLIESSRGKILKEIEKIAKEIYTSIESFDDFEIKRMDESFNCLNTECFNASVVMCASAVENRLTNVIKRKYPEIYKNMNIEKKTLGQILGYFKIDNPNEEIKKVQTILPKEHKPLIDLLNTYRIFSSHPKGKHVSINIANSIFSCSFEFLKDRRMVIKENGK